MKRFLKNLLCALFWIAVWLLAAQLTGSEILLPSPLSAARALCDLLGQTEFYLSVLNSVLHISLGFAIGVVLGVLMGAATYRSGFLKTLFSPLLNIVKATPVASFIVLLFVWLTGGAVASVTSLLIVLPIMWNGTFSALSGVDKSLTEMSRAFKVPARKRITALVIPAIKPYIKASAATAMGLAWKAGIAAEVICSPKSSIGNGIYESKVYLDTPYLFAWTAVVVLVSVLLSHLVTRLLGGKKEAAK